MSSNFLALYKRIKTLKINNQIGFGLIELMVSISIVSIVVGIIMTKQSTFNSAVLLRGQAYEIALRMREIQLSAVSASNDSGGFRSVLGLQFDSDSSNNNKYTIFSDANDNAWFDSGEEFDIQGVLDPRFEIRNIRVTEGSVTAPVTDLSIIFVRPNFDARFFDGPGASNERVDATVEIDVARKGVSGSSPSVLRTIEVTSTGQIGVK